MDLIFFNQKKWIVFAFLYVSLQVTQWLYHPLLIERGIMNFERTWWTDAPNFNGTFEHLWKINKIVKSLFHLINHLTTCQYWDFKAVIIAYFRETFVNTWNNLPNIFTR